MQYVCELARDGSGFFLCQEIGGPEQHDGRCSQPGQTWDRNRNGHAPSAMERIFEWCPTGQVLLLDLAQGSNRCSAGSSGDIFQAADG